MLKSYAVALLITLPLAFAFGQADFYPAKVWLKDGQRLTGAIEKPDWAAGKGQLRFRRLGETTPLPAATIDRIVLTENNLERRYINRTLQRLYLPDTVPVGDTLLYLQDTLLLQAVVEGSLSLYYHESPGGRAHYFLEKNGAFTELVHHEYQQVGSGRRIRLKHERWREQLGSAVEDCQKVANKLPQYRFSGENMRKLVVQYNECVGQRLDYKLKYRKFKVRPGIMAGGAFTRISTGDRIFRDVGTGQLAPRIGGSLLLLPTRADGRSGFLAELLYAPFRTVDGFDNIEVQADYIQLNLGVRNSGIAEVYGSILAGISIATQVGQPTLRNLSEQAVRPTQIGLFGGFTVSGEHVEVTLCYEIDDIGLLSPNAAFFYANSLNLIAGYRF